MDLAKVPSPQGRFTLISCWEDFPRARWRWKRRGHVVKARERRREKKTKNKTTSRVVFLKKKNAANQATIRVNRWLLCCTLGSETETLQRASATSEQFHLDAGYPYSKTVPSLSPSRPPKAFDPVNIITGESARAGRQRDSTMRENCREKDESGRYQQQFGAKVILMFSEPLNINRTVIYFFPSLSTSHDVCDRTKEARGLHITLWILSPLFYLSHGDNVRQNVEISVQGLSLTTSDLIIALKPLMNQSEPWGLLQWDWRG